MANLTDADKVIRNDVGKSIVSKLDDIADAIVQQGGGAHSLGQLSDVDIDTQTLAEGQSIVYNETTQKFENGEVSTVAALDDLTDVSITSAQQGDSLRNDGNGNWINEPTTIEMTSVEWDAIADKQAWRNAHKNTHLVITDAPNLNVTAQDISYDGGADTVWDKVEAVDELANKYNDASLLCTATVIEPTLSNGTSVNHRTYYYKKGTRVFVSIAVSGLTANTNQLLFTLPSGYRPSTIILPIGCDDSFNQNTVLLVKTDGNIEMRKNATQAYAFFEFDAFA